ncbi:hypothetical protein [Pseudomonas sp. RT6P73]
MRRGKLLFSLLVVSLLFAQTTLAITGPEVAQLLNSRYRNTTAECAGDNPAYFCSGVLLLPSQGPGEFWTPDAPSTTLGARSFAYVRADLDTRTLTQKHGAVFSDQFTAIGWGKPLEVLCVYPFDFPVQGTRPDFGCGWTAAAKNTQDVSSCTALGVTDAPGWLAHFGQQGNQPAGQCSLSSRDPAQFLASLTVHQNLDADWSASPTLLQVKIGDVEAPRQLPLQGLFYDVTQTGSLLGAQKDQRDYFTATGDWLPILRMNLTQAPDAVFGFNQQDQLYVGYAVAAELNARSIGKATSCRGNTASHFCTGVLIRTTDVSPAFHSWNPSDSSIRGNGVSFTYIRDSALITKVYKPQGFIIRESFAPSGKALTVRCLYPFDAGTGGSADICRTHGGQCDELGITTRESWVARYASSPTRTCAFNANAEEFQLATTVRPDATDPLGWNELIMAAWTTDNPEQLPLEAITINTPSHIAGDGVAGARYIQRDYFLETGRFVPIVRVFFSAAPGSIFSYDPQDQTVDDTTMTMLSNAIPFLPGSLRDD